jgi:hypothetical protein
MYIKTSNDLVFLMIHIDCFLVFLVQRLLWINLNRSNPAILDVVCQVQPGGANWPCHVKARWVMLKLNPKSDLIDLIPHFNHRLTPNFGDPTHDFHPNHQGFFTQITRCDNILSRCSRSSAPSSSRGDSNFGEWEKFTAWFWENRCRFFHLDSL